MLEAPVLHYKMTYDPQVWLYYYQDEAGLVPEHAQLLTTAR